MLKLRVLSSVVGLILLIVVVLLGKIAFGTAVFLIALTGMHEFFHSLEQAGYKPVKSAGYIACIPVLLIGLSSTYKGMETFLNPVDAIRNFSFIIFLLLVILFMFAVFGHKKYNINDLSLTLFGIFYVAFLFAFLVLTRNLENGGVYIWLIFIGAWATDTFAYFTGITIGRTRFLPAISSKKTLEGSIGGLVGCIAATTVYGLFVTERIGSLPLYHFIIIGMLCGILSQLGDWAASAVKRYVGVKDYGRLIPGHGGLLDRFDSILFIAPVIYFYISFL